MRSLFEYSAYPVLIMNLRGILSAKGIRRTLKDLKLRLRKKEKFSPFGQLF